MKKIFNYILFCGVTLFLGTNSIFAAGRQCVYCGGSVDESLGIPVGIPNFISSLIKVAKILVPIILIVSAMIRYVRVVMSGEDQTATEVNQSFIRSLIAAVFIFIIVSVVQTVFILIGNEGKSSLACLSCFVGGDCSNITTSCESRDTGICSNKNEEQCNKDSNICEWKNGKCTEIGTNSDPSELYNCYECKNDSSIRFWRNSNPGVTTACPDGYYVTGDTNKNSCLAANYACYKCNAGYTTNTTSVYLWHLNQPSPDYSNSACPSGWSVYSSAKTEEECKAMNPQETEKCYQCNGNSSMYYWGTSGEAYNYCSNAGYAHETTLSKSNCK